MWKLDGLRQVLNFVHMFKMRALDTIKRYFVLVSRVLETTATAWTLGSFEIMHEPLAIRGASCQSYAYFQMLIWNFYVERTCSVETFSLSN